MPPRVIIYNNRAFNVFLSILTYTPNRNKLTPSIFFSFSAITFLSLNLNVVQLNNKNNIHYYSYSVISLSLVKYSLSKINLTVLMFTRCTVSIEYHIIVCVVIKTSGNYMYRIYL